MHSQKEPNWVVWNWTYHDRLLRNDSLRCLSSWSHLTENFSLQICVLPLQFFAIYVVQLFSCILCYNKNIWIFQRMLYGKFLIDLLLSFSTMRSWYQCIWKNFWVTAFCTCPIKWSYIFAAEVSRSDAW